MSLYLVTPSIRTPAAELNMINEPIDLPVFLESNPKLWFRAADQLLRDFHDDHQKKHSIMLAIPFRIMSKAHIDFEVPYDEVKCQLLRYYASLEEPLLQMLVPSNQATQTSPLPRSSRDLAKRQPPVTRHSTAPKPSPSSNARNGLCYYHRTFGKRARKCKELCRLFHQQHTRPTRVPQTVSPQPIVVTVKCCHGPATTSGAARPTLKRTQPALFPSPQPQYLPANPMEPLRFADLMAKQFVFPMDHFVHPFGSRYAPLLPRGVV